ncbi:small acid-soluble spore protein O [Halalkalibacterium halodurans]|uniref:Small, acid-soluble spore protein O n=1 Tax=Halalkalibacterium halodurans (strain ATCC BAA-125 / DSM 18197 / FERM 7344 / JCM 9153 / C-125) TaxID=272558 RepID=SSPO_HALH5|nr:small acid-soluble spore protein O [Halalkalibacterium halodurans]Q9KAI7.1 RecName: Full=Small, acid-soluble spore protein O; Short=SASP O [Halalkalibacterium halodurans C-125]MDY7222851.1 small acid-soluble spore protein O [Halalkalibacterium halodurans]MDY7242072.1 small acid-soluble spore protein O [Halalkalibacterium halodurans]MED3648557.1 small acid-soluble spore protein O [Halalkalibacterium halodurans]MED4080918.1 small acid-soluble spore protein O [Halalkalibacterium halodurans]ME
MVRKKANHSRPGMNAAKAQGKDAGLTSQFHAEIGQEPLNQAQRQNNKKRKKNQ